MVMCEHVFSGCARGSGGWECRHCHGYWHIFGFDFVLSMSDLIDFKFLVYIFHYPVYVFCCLNLCIRVAYVSRGRCSSSSMMV